MFQPYPPAIDLGKFLTFRGDLSTPDLWAGVCISGSDAGSRRDPAIIFAAVTGTRRPGVDRRRPWEPEPLALPVPDPRDREDRSVPPRSGEADAERRGTHVIVIDVG